MRLINADALCESYRESIDECHKWAEEMRESGNEEMVIRAEQSLGTFVECDLRAKNAPTIEAIPIEWIDDFLEILENVGTTNNMFGMSIPIIQALVATWRENKDIKNIDDNGKN